MAILKNPGRLAQAAILAIALQFLLQPMIGQANAQGSPAKRQYLVEATGGPGFTSQEEMVKILEGGILPGFDYILKLQAAKTIVAGGLPVGERSFVFIIEADGNDEADRILRGIPFWGVFHWKVIPLESVAGRAATERKIVDDIKSGRR